MIDTYFIPCPDHSANEKEVGKWKAMFPYLSSAIKKI